LCRSFWLRSVRANLSQTLFAEHILFATDYPFAKAARGSARNFLATGQLSERNRNMIASEKTGIGCVQ
jgi:hypothetical protein